MIGRRNLKMWLMICSFLLALASDVPAESLTTRFGIVADCHYAERDPGEVRCPEEERTRYYRDSLAKLANCVDRMNEEGVDFLVELGDLKDQDAEPDRAKTLQYLEAIEEEFKKFNGNGSKYYVMGNHDVDSISKDEFWSKVTDPRSDPSVSYYSFDINDLHCIVLDACYMQKGDPPDYSYEDYDSGNFEDEWWNTYIPPAEMTWLDADLRATAYPTIVFIHQLLAGGDEDHRVKNADQVRTVLESAPHKVLAVFQGHYHPGDRIEIEGIHYYTLKALVEREYNDEDDEYSYAIVDVRPDGRIKVTGYGGALSFDEPCYVNYGESIQAAIDAAPDRDTIAVGPGTYDEAIDFLDKAIHLYSTDGPEVTTIDGTEKGYHVVQCVSGEGPDTILEGFTIIGGYASGLSSPDNCGGGMLNINSRPTVINCSFGGNTADLNGGGMCNIDGSSPTVTNCYFSENEAYNNGGGMYSRVDSNPTVTDCTFANNKASIYGGGMHSSGCSPTVADCSFSTNTAGTNGGGMYNWQANPTVTNCAFSGNTADNNGGGMFNHISSPTVINCTFGGNYAANYGGGMRNWESSPIVTNCTFTGNTAVVSGGGIYNDLGNPTVTNCILWGDTNGEIVGAATVNYSDVQGGWDGEGNIALDPLFADAEGRLSPGSPCIDAGDEGAVDVETDLDGNRRITDGGELDGYSVVDMGAYERPGPVHVPGDYASIQEAIDAAFPGDQIEVALGTYYEAINFNGKAVRLYSSSGPGETIIDATGLDSRVVTCDSAETPDTILEGFTITGGHASGSSFPHNNGGGMIICCASPTVINCRFIGNTANSHGGGMYNWQSNPEAINCTFGGNTADSGYGGGMCNAESNPTVTNCTFTGNTAVVSGGGAIYNYSCSPTVTNCILWGNIPDQIHNGDASTASVTYSNVQGNWEGEGNINENPEFADDDGRLSYNSPCIDKGYNNAVTVETDLDGNPRIVRGTVDMGAYEFQRIHNVTQDLWCSTIQAAIDGATPGDQIEVAPETYYETIDFDGKPIHLYSTGGPEVTIIDATGLDSRVVTCDSAETADTILEGFTITGGNASGSSFPDNNGGGMLNSGASPTVINCAFIGNTANSHGGGMYNWQSSPEAINCTFRGNTASSGYGGGMCNAESNPTVTNCGFSGNAANNQGGGGMYNHVSSPEVTNCTFSGNTADLGVGMYNINGSSPTVTNCILWDNGPSTSDQIYSDSSSILTVTYSDVEGGTGKGWFGEGCIDADPCFADAAGRLWAASPCIDAGANYALTVETDLDGNPRFADFVGRVDTGLGEAPIVDMGAYEYVWADADGDGIEDSVDIGPYYPSDSFCDGITLGRIDERGDQIIALSDAPDPLGVWIKSYDSTGDTLAEVFWYTAKGRASAELNAGDEAIVTHRSVEVTVLQGTVEITFYADDGTEAETSLNEGNSIEFEPETCVFTVPETNADDVVVIVDGSEIVLTPGESKLMAVNVADFGILALNGGGLTINSATSVIGDVGYSSGVASETNQKVTLFDGAALVQSQVQAFSYTEKNFAPTGGINYGEAVDLKLDKANAEAVDASAHYASLAPTHILGDLGDNDSVVVESVGHLNVVSLSSLKYKEDSMELVSREGFNDYFIFNVDGSFDFAASEIVLTGTTPDHVLFNFLGDSSCDIVINKAESVFYGTILGLSANIEYHNPATFVGAIIGRNINLHSDFNLIHEPFEYPW